MYSSILSSPAESLEDFISIVCSYGIERYESHREAAYFSQYDAVVGFVEETGRDTFAISGAQKIYERLAPAGIDISLEDFEDAIYTELYRRKDPPDSIINFISQYNKIRKLPDCVKNEFECYKTEKAAFDKMVREKVKGLHAEGGAEYTACAKQIKQLKSHRIKNLFFPKKYHEQLEKLEEQMDAANEKTKISENDYVRVNGDKSASYSPCIPIPDYLLDPFPDPGYDDCWHPVSLEEVNAITAEATAFINNPKNKNKYERYQKIIAAHEAELKEKTSSVQHKSKKSKASMPTK